MWFRKDSFLKQSTLELAEALCTSPANTLAFYQLVFLLTLEFSYQRLSDILVFLHQPQELAVKEKGLEAHHRVVLHATVAGGCAALASKISRNEVLKTHIDGVIAKRREGDSSEGYCRTVF